MTTTEDQSRRKDDTRAATALKWPEACSICAGTGTAFGKTCVCRLACNGSQVHPESALRSIANVPVAQPTPSDSGSVDTPTDLSEQLRERARGGYTAVHTDDGALMLKAADEIERYYGGMLAWKKTAEKKDRDWNAERMARVNDRCAQRAAASIASVDTGIFEDLLDDWRNAHSSGPSPQKEIDKAKAALIAHIESLIAARVAGVRKDALEEAAKVCERECVEHTGHPSDTGYNTAIEHCAAAIRALIHSPATSSKEGGAA